MTNAGQTGVLALRPSRSEASRSRYWFAGLLLVLGVVIAVAYSIAAQAILSNYADGFARASIPGQITLHVDHTATYYVYAEGALLSHPSVQVTDPQGHAVVVTATSPGPGYYHGGNGGGAVGRFDAVRSGDYKVAVSTDAIAQGDFAIGRRFPLWMRLVDWETWTPLALFGGASLVLIVRTATRRRRREPA
jgi:hypothetical protein